MALKVLANNQNYEGIIYLLNAAGAAAAGSAIRCRPGRKAVFQIAGTYVGTTKIQVSLDGTNWADLIPTTSTGVWEGITYPYMRGNVTAYTSGSITAMMSFE